MLQKVVLDFVDHSTCKTLYAADASTSSLSRGIVGETQLCAGVLEGGRDTCQVGAWARRGGALAELWRSFWRS